QGETLCVYLGGATRPTTPKVAVIKFRGGIQAVGVIPADVGTRPPNPPVPVLDAAGAATLDPRAFVEPIIWGWKRDWPQPALHRLAARQPDETPPTPPRLPSSPVFDLRALGITGCDLLAGSGLSYEAGLPMLKEIHDLFWVDDGYEAFCLGGRDQFPGLLRAD